MKKRHRIFIAINLPADVKKMLAGFQKQWADLPARWTNPQNLHITLAFLGYITDLELGQACIVTKQAASQSFPFSIVLNHISYGPDAHRPRMVWAAIEKSKELSVLKRGVEEALSEAINYKPEGRSFNPHINLSRIQQMAFRAIDLEERPGINEDIDIDFPVESIEVMESVLKKTGPEYSIIESFSLIGE